MNMEPIQETKLKKQNPFKKLFATFDKQSKIYAILALIFIGLSAAADLSIPTIMSEIMDSISTSSATKLTANDVDWYLFGIMAGLAVFSISFQSIAVWLTMKNTVKTSSMLRHKVFKHTRNLSSSDFDKLSGATVLTVTTSDITQMEQFLISYNAMTIKSIFFLLGGLGLSLFQLAKVDGEPKIWYSCFAYLGIVFIVLIAGLMMKKALPNFKESRNAVDANNVAMQENIVGHKLIRALNLQKVQANKYNKGNLRLRDLLVKSEKIIAVLVPTVFAFLNISMIVIYTIGGIYSWWVQPSAAAISIIGSIFAFSQYLAIMLLGFILFAQFGYTLSRARVSTQRIFNVLEMENSIKEATNPKKISNGDIELKNVCFKYRPDAENTVLKNLNVSIKSGQSLGVIGQTGSGKSSLVKILTRLYDISSGSLKISGHDIKDISFDSLRNDISVSLQEKVIISGTFKSNILIGKPDASDKEVIEAAKDAEAWEFISKKENDINGVVEERGSNLSGGQKQRLSIARALIKNPKILIFDDSTSALDTLTEKKIMNNINKKLKGVTKIIISQKVKSIQNCDKIIVMDNGKVVQVGTHNELLKNKKGIYARINESQKTSLEGQ